MLLLYAFAIVYVNSYVSNLIEKCKKDVESGSTCEDSGLPADLPQFPGLPYWILIWAFVTAFYEVFSYNDVFNEIMLPRAQDIHEQYPDEFKAASYLLWRC